MDNRSINWTAGTTPSPSTWAILNELTSAGYTVTVFFHLAASAWAMPYVEMTAWKRAASAKARIEIDGDWHIDTLSTAETAAYCCAIELLTAISREKRLAA